MSNPARSSQLLIYEAEDGAMKFEVRFEEDTVWLTQLLMADLRQTARHESTHKELLSVDRRDVQ